mgnify:CR=1 FL=1
MAKSVSSEIRKVYLKQRKLEMKKKAGKGVFALILAVVAIVFSDSLLKEKE